MSSSPAPDAVQEWLGALRPQSRPIVERLRSRVAGVAPGACELVYHGALGYGPTASGFDRILYIAVHAAHVNLGFFHAAGLADEAGLLEGSGVRMRHVKLRTVRDCDHPGLEALLRAAWSDGLAAVERSHRRTSPPRPAVPRGRRRA